MSNMAAWLWILGMPVTARMLILYGAVREPYKPWQTALCIVMWPVLAIALTLVMGWWALGDALCGLGWHRWRYEGKGTPYRYRCTRGTCEAKMATPYKE